MQLDPNEFPGGGGLLKSELVISDGFGLRLGLWEHELLVDIGLY